MGFFITGMFLFTASFMNSEKGINGKNSFLIGLAQAISLVPGISRSGATVSTGILSGIKREEAIRFSFLLAIPALIGASILNFWDMKTLPWDIFVSGFFTAFFSGLFAIFIFVKHLELKRFRWFAFYCWFMAIVSFILWQVL
jgi:undecaprenyl-diphosphatase